MVDAPDKKPNYTKPEVSSIVTNLFDDKTKGSVNLWRIVRPICLSENVINTIDNTDLENSSRFHEKFHPRITKLDRTN